MVCCQTNEVLLMKLIISERMFVHLQFGIGDISQSFHQRCSELATEGRSGILRKLLLKTVLLKASRHSLPWLLNLGDIPNLVFDVFCSLKIDHMQSFQLVFSRCFFIVAYHSVHMYCENQYPQNRQNSEI